MEWIYLTLQWYFALFCVGIVFFGITKKLFSSFFDQGYAFSKTIGILLLSYCIFLLGNLHIAPFNLTTLIVCLCIAFVIGLTIQKTNTKKVPWRIIIFEEVFFLIALFFWTYIRGQEPSIHGLEKFMDFGFIQSILRTSYFPPLDMWYSKLPINYYYFGHLTGAIQIRLSGVPPVVGYNLLLATIFAQSLVTTFSLVTQIVFSFAKKLKLSFIFGFIGAWILNFGGNLHTIYLLTSGYSADKPIPFWEILSGYNPAKYWYPNATRFIPFTIHEFPSYSYVVADLHGHVFDILFVLLTLAILFIFFTKKHNSDPTVFNQSQLIPTVLLGFMCAIHYMTNAFDGPIYLLLTLVFLLVMFNFSQTFAIHVGALVGAFLLFSLPFSIHFKPFATAIGMNCSPSFLTSIGKIGPFLFEKGNCQPDELWMLFVLWGFFFISFLLFIWGKASEKYKEHITDDYIFILFSFGIFLILIPEFFYIKDIYPTHFRANTMFKMGYQAFMMLSVASTYTFFVISRTHSNKLIKKIIWIIPFLFMGVYMFYAAPSYYGGLDKTPQLDGSKWLSAQNIDTQEIITYMNKHITGQPVILEAQGDSYTDFNHVSAYTGLPTVAGWWVHEWLWRGSADAVGKRIPDVNTLYESKDLEQTKKLITKYDISYIIVSSLERQKYKELQEAKFSKLGKKIFESSNGFGALYQVKR
jgi:uncharacterized membrane protein